MLRAIFLPLARGPAAEGGGLLIIPMARLNVGTGAKIAPAFMGSPTTALRHGRSPEGKNPVAEWMRLRDGEP
ncbi:hypothetical protein ES708_09146 [subsurface metagenome]